MILLKYFTIAFILSALGTIPIGLITLTISQRTIEQGKSVGRKIALGATVVEFTYTIIALYGLNVIPVNAVWTKYIEIGTIFLFLLLGIYYLRKPSLQNLELKPARQGLHFLQGIGIGMMNMLIVPFWLVVGLWLQSNGLAFDQNLPIVIFSFGAALGALLIFIVYIEGSVLLLNKSKAIATYSNKVIGSLFIILVLFQIIRLL